MSAIKQGDPLPPFPFQVVCVDNKDREKDLIQGATYTVYGDLNGGHSKTASADFLIQGTQLCFAIRRFRLAAAGTPTVSAKPQTPPTKDLTDWKVWRDVNRNHMHCPCGIFEEDCRYHRT